MTFTEHNDFCCSNRERQEYRHDYEHAQWQLTRVCLEGLIEISAATHLLKFCDLSPVREGQSACHLFVLYQIFSGCFPLHTHLPCVL